MSTSDLGRIFAAACMIGAAATAMADGEVKLQRGASWPAATRDDAPRGAIARVYTDSAVVDLHGASRAETLEPGDPLVVVPVTVYLDAERTWFTGSASAAEPPASAAAPWHNDVRVEFPGAPERLRQDLVTATRFALARQPDVLARGDPAGSGGVRHESPVAPSRVPGSSRGSPVLEQQRGKEARRRASRLDDLERLMTEPELRQRPSSRARQRARSQDAGLGRPRSGSRSGRGRSGAGRR